MGIYTINSINQITTNTIKDCIANNDPIEDKLHVIAVISNPCNFQRRYTLMREFINRISREENVILYIVELIYSHVDIIKNKCLKHCLNCCSGNKNTPINKYVITDSSNKNHLQLVTNTVLWHKENLINLGVKHLLPKDYKAFAWIDADIEFESTSWALDTLKVLNGSKDIVQLFSHCLDMDNAFNTMNIWSSAGYQYSQNKKHINKGADQWHPGYAWAITRKAYEKIEGLYEYGIVGSGDNIMLYSLLGKGIDSVVKENNIDYKTSILLFEEKIKTLRFGYIPGVIKHHYHGSKKNRKYQERWKILVNHNYSPYTHLTKNKIGLLVPTDKFNESFKNDLVNYFMERNEDS